MVKLDKIKRVYSNGALEFEALKNVELHITKGEYVAIMGPSGSGKSTLMNILGCLDRPTSGDYYLAGENVAKMNDDQLSIIRNKKIGFVFQSFNLLKTLSALDNVALPLVYSGLHKHERHEKAEEALKKVGLGDKLTNKPNELSGGQKQRVAIARAIVNSPDILMADEPTGNLDSKSELEILKIFKNLNESGSTIIMVTHEDSIADHCKRIVTFRDGEMINDEVLRT